AQPRLRQPEVVPTRRVGGVPLGPLLKRGAGVTEPAGGRLSDDSLPFVRRFGRCEKGVFFPSRFRQPRVWSEKRVEGLAQVGVSQAVIQREQLGPPAPGFGIVRESADHRLYRLKRGFVLPVIVLLKSLVNLGVNVVAAPLEFLAAAAGTGGIWINGHRRAAF